MNRQMIFDDAAKHMLAQKERSIAEIGLPACAYRGVGGLKCAIGALIPDDRFNSVWNTSSARCQDVRKMIDPKYGVPVGPSRAESEVYLSFLTQLQRVHDMCDPAAWRPYLRAFAERFGLDPFVLN